MESDGAGPGDLKLRGGIDGLRGTTPNGVERGAQLLAQQAAVHQRIGGRPARIGDVAIDHFVVAELRNLEGRGKKFPGAGDVAMRGVVGAGFAQLGEETEEVELLRG